MMTFRIFILAILVCSFSLVTGQQNYSILNANSITTKIYDRNRLFRDVRISSAAYELGQGSGNHLIYSGSFWFGGVNQDGELKLAADKFGRGGEFRQGPYSTTGQYLDTAYLYQYESGIWTVSKEEIIYHLDNYDQPGYIAPPSILNWLGNGNSVIGVAEQLAPFVDVNNNGIYEPYEGDYPCIKGDMTSYQIFNEDGEHFLTNGGKIGIEVHLIFYQIQASDYIDSTTFIDLIVINRGNESYNDFRTALHLDPDIGYPETDYIGSNSPRNIMYAYKATNYDPGFGGAPGFGYNPPAVGVMSLNKDIGYLGYFNREDMGNPNINSDPKTPEDYWKYMNGKWLDGTNWVYGGSGHISSPFATSIPTQYIYDGNPYLGTGWTELDIDGENPLNYSGDRRFFISSNGEPLYPGDSLIYNYAIIVNRQGNHLENVDGLLDYADLVKEYFNTQNFSCQQEGAGIVDNFEEEEEEDLRYYFEIVRVDGEGNMGRPVNLHYDTELEILAHDSVQAVRYTRGAGPIEVRLLDSTDYALGHFVLKFDEYTDVNEANWTVYHYDTIGGNLLETIHSNSTIEVGEEHIIPQWNMSITVKQEKYSCFYPECKESYRKTVLPLEANLTFEDEENEWLTGVKNVQGMTPLNWIKTGHEYYPNSSCYNSIDIDPNNLFAHLAEGIVAPSFLTRYNDCGFSPITLSSSVGELSSLNILQARSATVYQPSIDIVFTDDTSKWTRSPVIELNTFDVGSVNGGKAGFLRQSPSVDKQGNPDGKGTGMGWFPGYAIDVETGRRLNMAFGENSTLTDDNGDDMIWNPTERVFDDNGNYVLGGQHVIYVFGRPTGRIDKYVTSYMPVYDKGEWIRERLQQETIQSYKEVYQELSWGMQPLLVPNAELNSSTARLKVRINKEFKSYLISDENEKRPMFYWDSKPFEEIFLPINEEAESQLEIYPNPSTNHVNIVWEGMPNGNISIFSLEGKNKETFSVNQKDGELSIDVSSFPPGIYFIKMGSETKKLIVL